MAGILCGKNITSYIISYDVTDDCIRSRGVRDAMQQSSWLGKHSHSINDVITREKPAMHSLILKSYKAGQYYSSQNLSVAGT
jgi:hypothetical protein